MATTVTSTKSITRSGFGGGPKQRGPNGNGSPRGNGNYFMPEFTSSRYRIGMWVAMAAILMMFTALTSAYIVRAASSDDWRPLTMPRVLLLSTMVLIVSSLTMEVFRRKSKSGGNVAAKPWLFVTVALGIGFVAAQLLAWKQLAGQGIYVWSNPHSSFFYLLTATHGVHLLGGLMALVYLSVRREPRREDQVAVAKAAAGADAATLYWHFMDVLWVYVFALLFFWK